MVSCCFNILHIAQTKHPFDTRLYDLIAITPLGEILNSEHFTSYQEECQSLYKCYLDDFIKSMYRTARESEIKVLSYLHVYYIDCAVMDLLCIYSWSLKQLIQLYRKVLLIVTF